MLGLAIRYAHLEDAEAIADLVTGDPFERTVSRRDIAEMLKRGSFLVLDRDRGGLAATVFLEIRDGRGEVEMLAVASDLEVHNLPRRLIEVAEMVCVAKGCSHLELRIADGQALPTLGRDMGFRPAAESGLRLEKDLLAS